jgi:hypothetical protein
MQLMSLAAVHVLGGKQLQRWDSCGLGHPGGSLCGHAGRQRADRWKRAPCASTRHQQPCSCRERRCSEAGSEMPGCPSSTDSRPGSCMQNSAVAGGGPSCRTVRTAARRDLAGANAGRLLVSQPRLAAGPRVENSLNAKALQARCPSGRKPPMLPMFKCSLSAGLGSAAR